MTENTDNKKDMDQQTRRQQILDAVAHFDHVLPGQAPIKDFVHHNTLHGYQHLAFPDALKAAHELTGNYGYETEENFREYFKRERITENDLNKVIANDTDLQATDSFTKTNKQTLNYTDLYRSALINPLKSVTGCQLNWHIEELHALDNFQPDVTSQAREKLLQASNKNETDTINELWDSCLKALDLEHFYFHPEELIDLDTEQAEELLTKLSDEEPQDSSEPSLLHLQVHKESRNLLGQLLRTVGHDKTITGLLEALSGKNILEDVRPVLQRHLANYLDQGMSAWHSVDRNKGFFTAWRSSAADELSWIFDQMPEWHDAIYSLPDTALDTIIDELNKLGIPESHWTSYLERVALEIPGWSGLYMWRHLNPGYDDSEYPVDMIDYLAVRLVLERLFAQKLCRELWQIEANLDVIRWYFRRRRSEFYVRYILFNSRLPEYLVSLIQRQAQRSLIDHTDYQPWKHISDMIFSWRNSYMGDQHKGYTVFDHGWKLFRLAQHMSLCAADIENLNKDQIKNVFSCLKKLSNEKRGFLWLQAYEHHYREQLFNAVVKNENRGRWKKPGKRPQAQITFCMDDREEGIRRHLEEHNPDIETLGAAGFFGVAIKWQGLDDEKTSLLCPVVVDPVHLLKEKEGDDQQQQSQTRKSRRSLRIKFKDIIHQETRRNIFTPLLVALFAPMAFLSLLGKTFTFRASGRLLESIRDIFDTPVHTHVEINTDKPVPDATPENNQLGYTDEEQADRIKGFLCTVGLNKQLAPFVVMMGHGSMSTNNPHLSAYDCGACSGRHGGPNARIFAAIANRPEIRQLLKQRGINIPDDTWILGAEHNTCDEVISWYDEDKIPENMQQAFAKLKTELTYATKKSAHERCRRLASAPNKPSLKKALNHIIGRAYDYSQARPELGHATNAAAFIGRRSISQGAFFDRRVFLISYDPTQDDDEGHIIETILLNAGPVGAGINLEYYFSTVNNDRYGSGSKITHNVTGLFAVMDGTSSDLKTGLPKQMIEIHEAMRLQVLVEAKVEVLTKIYQRQPALQELVGLGWLLLSAKDPDSEEISVFDPTQGFIPWQGEDQNIPMVDDSTEWYDGHHMPLTPAFIKQETPNA
jgi:uncharacterized protein